MRRVIARRRIVFALLVAALLAGRPQDAWARQDWWGWLEEFSGPGPFTGFELSAEVVCINLAERRAVAITELEELAQLKKAGQDVASSLQAFQTGLENTPDNADALKNVQALRRRLAGVPAKDDASLESLVASLDAVAKRGKLETQFGRFQTALEQRRKVMETQVALAMLLGGTGAAGDDQVVRARSSREFTAPDLKFPGRSCRGAQRAIEADRQADRARSARLLATAGLRQLAPAAAKGDPESVANGSDEDDAERGAKATKATDIVFARRDWQTGLVIGLGRYRSIENKLFDPNGSRDDEPQLQVVPLELVAHSKVSSAIDIGAGFGIAFFSTRFTNEVDRQKYPDSNTKNTAFYLVPLSVVVRPARLFTNRPWASAIGYRVSLRYFGGLNAEDFGAPGEAYEQHGEFVWGAAGFIDLVSLFAR